MNKDELNIEILKGLSGEERANFVRGLGNLNMSDPTDRDALRKSIAELRPDYSKEEIEYFVKGRAGDRPDSGWI